LILTMEVEISPLLVEFRKLLTENNLDAYVIPRTDPHNSEILPSCDERLKFICSFSGSNGIAVISKDEALMWTDSRYYLQAPKELQAGWKMMKMAKEELQWPQWLAKNVPLGGKVGVNPFLMNSDGFARHEKNLKEKGIELVPLVKDLVEELWKDRPAISKDPVRLMKEEISNLKGLYFGNKVFRQACF
jgi:Xaa-Pro aminopeptidase